MPKPICLSHPAAVFRTSSEYGEVWLEPGILHARGVDILDDEDGLTYPASKAPTRDYRGSFLGIAHTLEDVAHFEEQEIAARDAESKAGDKKHAEHLALGIAAYLETSKIKPSLHVDATLFLVDMFGGTYTAGQRPFSEVPAHALTAALDVFMWNNRHRQ